MPPPSRHSLQSTAKLPPQWAGSPPPRESCDELCRFFTDQEVLPDLLARKPVTIFSGVAWCLFDWSRRGCPFAKLLTKWFPSLNPWAHLDITLERVKHRQGMREEAQLFELTVDPSVKSCYIEMVTDQHDPAGPFLVGRPVSPDPLSSQNIAFVSDWLNCCATQSKGHDECPKPDPAKTKLPTRVISVPPLGGQPRLHVTDKDQAGQYAALSYCWGGPQLHTTLTTNIADYTMKLPMQELPATIVDAIRLTQALSIPYLWVDSLCIIQDSEEDKVREIANMNHIYKSSWVTISAARASACHVGFLGTQEITEERVASSVTLPIACPDGSTGSAMLRCARLNYSKSTQIPVNRRAWTYQETFVSPRTVSYYDDSIEVKCLAGIKNNDDLKPVELIMRRIINEGDSPLLRHSTLASYFHLDPGHNNTLVPTTDPQELQRMWREVVSSYTAGILTVRNDKLPAISAIASEFHRLSAPGNTYLAGLWRHSLHRDLLWTRQEPEWWQLSPKRDDSAFVIPSWSWASIYLGQTSLSTFYDEFGTVASPRVEILDCSINLTSTEAAFGSVNGGRLTLRGPVQPVTTAKAWDMFGPESIVPLDINRHVARYWDDYRWGAIPPPDEEQTVKSQHRYRKATTNSGRLEWGIPGDRGMLSLLGLTMDHKDGRYENCGLILVEADAKNIQNDSGNESAICYERVGVFRIAEEYIEAAGPLRAEMESLVEHWGDKYEVKTMTIV